LQQVYLDQMAESWDGSYDPGSQSDDSHYFERLRVEPIYDAFVCPLTKQVMRDPVTLENGQTFEREAIEKWFKECKESGRKLVCPLTQKELQRAGFQILARIVQDRLVRSLTTHFLFYYNYFLKCFFI
jgi:hypothetical protein